MKPLVVIVLVLAGSAIAQADPTFVTDRHALAASVAIGYQFN